MLGVGASGSQPRSGTESRDKRQFEVHPGNDKTAHCGAFVLIAEAIFEPATVSGLMLRSVITT